MSFQKVLGVWGFANSLLYMRNIEVAWKGAELSIFLTKIYERGISLSTFRHVVYRFKLQTNNTDIFAYVKM